MHNLVFTILFSGVIATGSNNDPFSGPVLSWAGVRIFYCSGSEERLLSCRRSDYSRCYGPGTRAGVRCHSRTGNSYSVHFTVEHKNVQFWAHSSAIHLK